MRNLESLTVLRYPISSSICTADAILKLLLFQHDKVKLERLWITDDRTTFQLKEEDMPGPIVLSLPLSEMQDPVYELDDERFLYLEHLAGLIFRRLDHLHNLKYFQGYCKDDEEVICPHTRITIKCYSPNYRVKFLFYNSIHRG